MRCGKVAEALLLYLNSLMQTTFAEPGVRWQQLHSVVQSSEKIFLPSFCKTLVSNCYWKCSIALVASKSSTTGDIV